MLKLKWHPGKVAYLQLNTFNYSEIVDEFKAIFPELTKAKKRIIDLRNNGGGNTNISADILGYLTRDSLLIGSRGPTRVYNPAYMSWGE